MHFVRKFCLFCFGEQQKVAPEGECDSEAELPDDFAIASESEELVLDESATAKRNGPDDQRLKLLQRIDALVQKQNRMQKKIADRAKAAAEKNRDWLMIDTLASMSLFLCLAIVAIFAVLTLQFQVF